MKAHKRAKLIFMHIEIIEGSPLISTLLARANSHRITIQSSNIHLSESEIIYCRYLSAKMGSLERISETKSG